MAKQLQYRAEVEGSKDSIGANEWNGILEGAVQLMIYKGVDTVELFEWAAPYNEGPDMYVSVGELKLKTW